MSLNISLNKMVETEIFELGITDNLAPTARAAGLYDALWNPDKIECTHADDLIPALAQGLLLLRDQPKAFEELNPENGWDSYRGFLVLVERYLNACRDNPDATIRTRQ